MKRILAIAIVGVVSLMLAAPASAIDEPDVEVHVLKAQFTEHHIRVYGEALCPAADTYRPKVGTWVAQHRLTRLRLWRVARDAPYSEYHFSAYQHYNTQVECKDESGISAHPQASDWDQFMLRFPLRAKDGRPFRRHHLWYEAQIIARATGPIADQVSAWGAWSEEAVLDAG